MTKRKRLILVLVQPDISERTIPGTYQTVVWRKLISMSFILLNDPYYQQTNSTRVCAHDIHICKIRQRKGLCFTRFI